MKGHPEVIENLKKALTSELTAVHQYWLHEHLLREWGYFHLEKKWKHEREEEQGHAARLMERILFLEGMPNVQDLLQVRIGQTIKDILENDLAAEVEARTFYQNAAFHAHSVKDFPSRNLFEGLMADEEGHIDFLEKQLRLIKHIGESEYLQKNMGHVESSE
jgi:bacterioferritin